MRGDDQQQTGDVRLFNLGSADPRGSSCTSIRVLVIVRLRGWSAEFEKLYSATGRPSIAPERLLRATLLMILYSIRSERQ